MLLKLFCPVALAERSLKKLISDNQKLIKETSKNSDSLKNNINCQPPDLYVPTLYSHTCLQISAT